MVRNNKQLREGMTHYTFYDYIYTIVYVSKTECKYSTALFALHADSGGSCHNVKWRHKIP